MSRIFCYHLLFEFVDSSSEGTCKHRESMEWQKRMDELTKKSLFSSADDLVVFVFYWWKKRSVLFCNSLIHLIQMDISKDLQSHWLRQGWAKVLTGGIQWVLKCERGAGAAANGCVVVMSYDLGGKCIYIKPVCYICHIYIIIANRLKCLLKMNKSLTTTGSIVISSLLKWIFQHRECDKIQLFYCLLSNNIIYLSLADGIKDLNGLRMAAV